MSRLYRGLASFLARPNADRIILWFGFACLLASLDTGLAADDYLFTVMLDRPAPIEGFARAPLDLFRFCDPRWSPTLIEQGILMWWDDPSAKIAFFRPLTAVTHWFDHALFRNFGPLSHLHSALWSLLLFAGVRALYRELLADRFVATLALALYALDDARGWLVSWVAARNAPVATALSVWALWAHVCSRRGRLPNGAWLAPLLFGLGLLGSEGAIATFGYVLAYALWVEQGSWRARLVRLWPYALVIVGWRIGYRAFDYGVVGSSLYVDPLTDGLRFGRSFLEKAPILLSSQLGGMWSDAWMPLFFAPRVQLAIYLATLGFIVWVGRALWPLVRADPLLRFAVTGALSALVVATPAFLADRLLTWVAIGMSVVLASLLAPRLRALEPARERPRLLIAFLVVSHLVVGVVFMPWRARGTQVMRNFIDRVDRYIPSDPSVSQKSLVFVNPPHVPFSAYPPIERAAKGEARPRVQYTLATSTTEVTLTRLDERTLRIEPRGGYLQNPSSRMLWSERRKFRVGEELHQGELTVRVRAITADARPLAVEARFEHPLEHPAYIWRQWLTTHAAPFKPPTIGARLVLPGADYVQAMLGISLTIPAKF